MHCDICYCIRLYTFLVYILLINIKKVYIKIEPEMRFRTSEKFYSVLYKIGLVIQKVVPELYPWVIS